MEQKTNLIKKFLELNLSESSIKNYIRNLELLNDGKPFTNYTFLKNKEKIMDKINEKKPNTQRSYLISIVSFFKALNIENKLSKYYYDKMMDINQMLKTESSKNIKTESQEKNWVTQEEAKNKLNELVDIINNFKTKNITEKQYNVVLQMIILSLYILQAPRRNADYQYMIVMKNKTTNDNINFLLYDKKEFVFRKYKTAKTELKNNDKKELVVDISDELMDNINLYFKYHPLILGKKINNYTNEVPFLVKSDGEPLLYVNSITYILNKIFDKNVGSSILRHSYLSDKYGDKLNEMKKDAIDMSHGLQQQKEYIKD